MWRNFFISGSSEPLHDTPSPSVLVNFYDDSVANEDAYTMQSHFPRKVRKDNLATLSQFDPEERIGKSLFYDPLHFLPLCIHSRSAQPIIRKRVFLVNVGSPKSLM